jgi:hypothetical protein
MQGLEAMPPEYRRCYDSWAPKHPDWEILLWDREKISQLGLLNEWVFSVDNPTVQSEVLRFEIVYSYGGIYLDADTECLKPIDQLLMLGDAFVSMRNKRHLENNGFGAIAGHDWIEDIVRALYSQREKIREPLQIDGVFLRSTPFGRVATVPYYTLHCMNEERDTKEVRDKALAIHHRFSLWMKAEETHA